MLEFILATENLPFTAALALMVVIGLVEAAGFGLGSADMDVGAHADADLLGWLGVGKVPLLALLVVLLALFGLIGFGLQQLAAALLGGPLSPWIAAPAAFVASLPLLGTAARGLGRILPQDETTAVGLDSLLGRRATITVGTARSGSPAQARVRDVHGQAHYVMVEPTDAASVPEGASLLLVRREGDIFIGLYEGERLEALADRPQLGAY